jgi:hypothetical protein
VNQQLAIRCPDGVFRANNCVIDTPPGLSSTIVAVLISLSAVLLFAIFAVCWFYRRASSAIAPMDLEMQDTQPPRRSTTVLANSLFRELPPDATTPSTPSMRVPIPVPEYQALQSPITTSPITRESTAIHNNSERATHLNEPAHMGSRLKSSIIVNR